MKEDVAAKAIVPAEETVGPLPARGFAGFIGKFTVLRGAQRELWLTFLIKFLIYTAYSITNKTMILWLSKDLGFSDQGASAMVGWVWAPAMTIFTLLAGSLTDAIGLRRTFFLGVAICTVARSVMATTTIPWLALGCGVLPLAVGEALGHAGVARGDTLLFNHGATVDLLFHHLRDHECRLPGRGIYFRFRQATRVSSDLLWLRANYAPTVISR